jgi:hypothetical protein
VREKKTVRPKQSYSESQTSSDESEINSNDTSYTGATMWVKKRQNA